MIQPGNQHIIQKQTFEISFENPATAVGLQDRIALLFYEQIKPRMEQLLDEMFGHDQYASIDTLEIDLGLLNDVNWEQEITDKTLEKLKNSLTDARDHQVGVLQYRAQVAAQTFFFFLENGFMPWNSRVKTSAELEQLLTPDSALISRLKEIILLKDVVAERLVYQFSENFIHRVMNKTTENQQETIQPVLLLLHQHPVWHAQHQPLPKISKKTMDIALLKYFARTQKLSTEHFFSFLLNMLQGDEALEAGIHEIINTVFAGNINILDPEKIIEQEHVEKQKAGKTSKTGKKEEQPDNALRIVKKTTANSVADAIYIENAGLVLLHPFLMHLFENFGLVRNDVWIDATCQQKAVLVLHYLAKGISPAEEFELVLNKIMCGLQPEDVINTEIQPDESALAECESLLASVISHWRVLRNTSAGSFRETFLLRNGKLSKVDQGWLLQVEQKTFDVLLNHLPWGIGIIKMPIMSEMLFVEWA